VRASWRESNATFLPLFVNLQLNSHVEKEEMGAFVIPPYDLHCPSVEPQLVKCCCSVSGIYHASVESAVNHTKLTSLAVQGLNEKLSTLASENYSTIVGLRSCHVAVFD
jgi:hypothetical protein